MTKWEKFKILKEDERIAAFLPETRWMTEKNLWELLGKYGSVILKPFDGFGGSGVVKVSSRGANRYEVHFGMTKQILDSKKLYSYLKKKIKLQDYIVQRWISLAKVDHRPFDLRVMVQRKIGSPWKVTGKLAKVAGKGYIITNIARSKGVVIPVETAIQRSSLKNSSTNTLLKQIDRVTLQTAKRLQPFYPRLHIIGLDLGIDHNGKVWIIEANFNPAISLFLHLKDKSMYRRIQSYIKINK